MAPLIPEIRRGVKFISNLRTGGSLREGVLEVSSISQLLGCESRVRPEASAVSAPGSICRGGSWVSPRCLVPRGSRHPGRNAPDILRTLPQPLQWLVSLSQRAVGSHVSVAFLQNPQRFLHPEGQHPTEAEVPRVSKAEEHGDLQPQVKPLRQEQRRGCKIPGT